MNGLHPLGAQFLQPANLGVDIVGLDIEVHAAGMAHLLYLDVQAVVRVLESLVDPLASRQLAHRHTERRAPKAGGPV
jgi:hypothetical protein